jgi:hypothetical protein
MTENAQTVPVLPDENLARFVTTSSWLRADRTVKPDAFIPPKDLQFSVTRHLDLSEEQLWQIGRAVVSVVAEKRTASLHGRADLHARTVSSFSLIVEPAAHITGWPLEKSARKNMAQQLAAAAKFIQVPA